MNKEELLTLLEATLEKNVQDETLRQVFNIIDSQNSCNVDKNHIKIIFEFYYKYANDPFHNSNAQNMLGLAYANGANDEKIYKTSQWSNQFELHWKWLERSAQQGNSHALYNIGVCHVYGDNIAKKKDIVQATHYLKQSAALGNPYAHHAIYKILSHKDYEQMEYHASAMIKSSTHQMIGFDIIHDLYREYRNQKNISKLFQLFQEYPQELCDDFKNECNLILDKFLENCDECYIDIYLSYLSRSKQYESINTFKNRLLSHVLNCKETRDNQKFINALIDIGCDFNMKPYHHVRADILLSSYTSYQKLKCYILNPSKKDTTYMNRDIWNLIGSHLAWFENIY